MLNAAVDSCGGPVMITDEMTGDLPVRTSFQDTQWSVVAIVRRMPESPEARKALAELCAVYWYPLYAFARQHGLCVEDAQDATQSFFARVVRDNLFAAAIPEKGRLRMFLMAAFRNHMSNERKRARAAMRGGAVEMLPLDFGEGESRYLREPADSETPERHFDRNWAETVLHEAAESLGRQERHEGRGEQFAALRAFITPAERAGRDYAAAARRLGTTMQAVRAAVSRLRGRFRERVSMIIAQTLDAPDSVQVEEEMAALLAALADR